MKRKQLASDLLAAAGITLNGSASTDIQVYDDRFFDRVFAQGQLALGESFMDGWWDVSDLTGFITKLLESPIRSSLDKFTMVSNAFRAWLNYRQSRDRNKVVATQHYNMDGRVFRVMLDKRYAMYTCGLYRTGATTPEEAQEAKLELSGRKLQTKPGQVVLDVGSGFTAGFLRYMVEHHDVRGVGIVNSEAQYEQSSDIVRGMPIEIRLQDYRDIEGRFDRICSMGMFEHVGPGNYGTYFRKMSSLLTDDGLMLLHHIGSREPKWRTDPWHDKYIFPHGVLPSLSQDFGALEPYFVCEDVDNFGADYDPTLQGWYRNLDDGWQELEETYGTKQDSTFRMMKYYLLSSAGGFRSRYMQLFQLVLSKNGIPGGYIPVR